MDRTLSVLFICYANTDRSPCAEEIFLCRCKEKSIDVKVSSAGLYVGSGDGKKVLHSIVQEQDIIFVMEEYMREELIRTYDADSIPIIVLNVKEPRAGYEKEKLREEIRGKLRPYINKKRLGAIVNK